MADYNVNQDFAHTEELTRLAKTRSEAIMPVRSLNILIYIDDDGDECLVWKFHGDNDLRDWLGDLDYIGKMIFQTRSGAGD